MKQINFNEKYLILDHDSLECENCCFNENCEELFNACAANWANDRRTGTVHLRNCEIENFEKLNEDEQDQFTQYMQDMVKMIYEDRKE